MPEVNCKVCHKRFRTKDFYIKKGYGIYCSRSCYYGAVQNGQTVACAVCKTWIYRGLQKLARSKSKKYFCSKSCQTVWRNQQYVGTKHKLWKGGWNVRYRNIMLKNGKHPVCRLCREQDERIVVVHHKDENRSNNSIENLVWLCRNCHHLVHYDNLEKQRLFKRLHKQMVPI